MIEPLQNKITSHAELRQRIAYLESIKDAQEEVLKQNIIRVHESLKPAELLKSAIESITSNEAINNDVKTVSVNLGIDLLVGKIFKENESTGGLVKSLIAKQVLHGLYNKYQDKINAFIGNLTGRVIDFLGFDDSRKAPDQEKEE